MQDINNENKTPNIEENAIEPSIIESSIKSSIKRRPQTNRILVVISLIGFVLIAAVAIIQAFYIRSGRKIPELPTSRASTNVNEPSPVELSKSFREIAKIVKPALVFIEIEGRANQQQSF